MFVSQEIIKELTGYKRFTEQKRWLIEHGYTFQVGGDGKIKLLKSHIEEQMSPSTRTRRTIQPDFSSLRA